MASDECGSLSYQRLLGAYVELAWAADATTDGQITEAAMLPLIQLGAALLTTAKHKENPTESSENRTDTTEAKTNLLASLK